MMKFWPTFAAESVNDAFDGVFSSQFTTHVQCIQQCGHDVL